MDVDPRGAMPAGHADVLGFGTMRRALAGVIVGLLVVVACSGDDDSGDRAEEGPKRTPRPEIEEPGLPDLPPYTESADGGAVVVAEKGFSVFADSEGEPLLSWGVVVENTSAQVATLTDVKVEPVDAGGVAVPMGSASGVRRVETIRVLLPGQRLGIGQADRIHGTGVTDLRVEIGGSLWFPTDAVGVELAPITTSGATVSGDSVDFVVDSGYSRPVPVQGGAVFRNAAGQIVGGTSRHDSLYDLELAAGQGTGRVNIVFPVPEADPAKAEVYVDVRSVVTADEATLAQPVEVDSEGESSPDEFCALYEQYQLRNQAAGVGGQDPRFALAPLAAIEPPRAIAAEWETFVTWRWAIHAAVALASFDVAGSPPSEVIDQYSEVTTYWIEECVGERGYDNVLLPFNTQDEPDELPPFAEPESGEVRVVEQGWSPTADSSGSPQVTYGVVVENTTDQVATNLQVSVRAVGATLPDYGGEHTIPVLLPGQRYGLGETLYADASAMTGLEVTVGGGQPWWPADHELLEFGEITTGEVTINRSPHGPYAVTFAIDSTYHLVRSGHFHVVFRNADGQIVGGANDDLFGAVPPGRSFGEVYSNYPVPDVTDTATEVYV